jgi:two-component system, chemotaxis family, chemotaxis protein CheY
MSTPRTYEILAVDDNEADLRLIQEAFSDCGHSCHLTCTNSIQDAVKILQAETFDLVLADMGPTCEGLELVRVIRGDDRHRATPIIVLSGILDPLPAYAAGANAFVSKAADLDTFFARIRDVMHFWVNVAELPSGSPLRPTLSAARLIDR